jgi:hypothetical protein
MGEKISNRDSEKHWLHLEEVQFKAVHFDWKAEIVLWHHKYLVQMKRPVKDGREIVYVDESWIDSNITSSKCWEQTNTATCRKWKWFLAQHNAGV